MRSFVFNVQKTLKVANIKTSRRDFQDLFDPEVHELIKLISAQIESLKRSNRDKKLVDYSLVLSTRQRTI